MIKTSLLLLLIAHLLGDFYFQPKTMVENKLNRKILAHIMHALVHFVIAIVLTVFFFEKWWVALLICFVVSLLHFGTDYLKSVMQERFERKGAAIALFFVDQSVHIITLIVASLFLVDLSGIGNAFFGGFYDSIGFGFSYDTLLLYVFSLLFVIQPANIINRFILDTLFQKKEEETAEESNDAKAGKIIGYLERLTMYCFLAFLGRFEIIPIVLTVKTFVRFRRFDTSQGDSFAEKYIVGTLLSTLYVGICLLLKLGVV